MNRVRIAAVTGILLVAGLAVTGGSQLAAADPTWDSTRPVVAADSVPTPPPPAPLDPTWD
ncbi:MULTISPECIES: hypothetical protein [Streptomyces]|uniref:Uncharacterized protein n=1 Tax=Streptomyces noboritoensis TaxID=67337 RepID=A0ABV6TCE8_9ACTN|nr:hypothetical protein [Streptomyces melanogenes]